MIFFAVFLCRIEPTCQSLCFYNKNCEFWPFGPLFPFLKGALTHQKRKFSKITISSVLLCHTEPTYQKLCFYAHNYVFWLLGPFLKIKGPLKGAEMHIFKN